MSLPRRLSTAALLVLLLSSCATTGGVVTDVPAATELPRSLAVLPFVPLGEREDEARVLARMIYGSLSATSYDVIKPQVVEERLVRAGLADPRALAAKSPAELAKLLDVDGLVYGEMTHYDRIFLGIYAQIAAGGSIKLVDARSGRTLFERAEVERSHTGGLPTDALGAAIQVVKSALKLREIELIRACDDLVRSLLKGVPTPPAHEARRPPAFTHVVSDGAGRLLKTGDVVTVIAHGAPGVVGSFDVLPLGKNLPLEETTPGVYTGRYAVKPGDTSKETFVVARLADRSGRVSEREDILGRFWVDAVPPAVPAQPALVMRDARLELGWTPPADADLAGYRVYRSESPLTGFTQVATTEAPAFAERFTGAVYYRVTAVDRAGNESEATATIALPVAPRALSGALERETYLVPGEPYVVSGRVVITHGAVVHVLPGVVVRLAPGAEGFVVQDGSVLARGRDDAPIVFTSASERPKSGDYVAALHVRAKPSQVSVLHHVRVEHASVGLRVESGGIDASHLDVTNNQQAGVDVADTGVLKLSDSRIGGHAAGGAVTVRGFGRATLRNNHIVDNGWAVVNYSGNQVDARGNWWGVAEPADTLFVGDVDRRDSLGGSPTAARR
ncbi:MAG TPA: GNA1162 family protein [Terriglobales bacterium]|nr:GNA1162 family protein [Terriglobales bacterium]